MVSAEGAKRYGVVIAGAPAGAPAAGAPTVDAAATEKLRADLIAERGDDIPLFNYGGSIEEIKARCEEETHLPAPETPVFRTTG